ncbi:MAG: shikimate kinase, partial [Oscillospiraceae bacterium]
MADYGLLGEKLSHSFSKIIHEKLQKYHYELMPMNIEELHLFLKNKKFSGVNVTIPYKKEVMAFCDKIEENAKKIGAVNTIVNENNKLIGYNTDFSGFLYLLKKNNINVKNKTVLILGSGATHQTIKAVLEYEQAKKIFIVSRKTNENNSNYITYDDVKNNVEASKSQIIINATPVGMFPNCNEISLDLANFDNLEAVVDAIYNPLNTRLLQQAKQKKVKSVNGLLMLVAQAVYACELFTNQKIPQDILLNIYNEIQSELVNIVFVGMPSAGKSTVGIELAKIMKREFVDIDELIKEKEKMTIPQIFKEKG